MSTKFEDHLYPRGRSATEPDLIPSVKDSDGNSITYSSSKRKTTEATVVNLGSSPNSNDGDPLRTSFGKINNFIEASYWVNESINKKFRDIDSELKEGVFLYTDSDERHNISLLDDTKFYLRGNPTQIEVNVTNPNDSEVSVNFNLTETVDINTLNIREFFSIFDSDGVKRVSYKSVDYPTTYNERVQNGVDAEFNIGTNVVLGRDSDDVVIVNGRVASNLVPYGDEIYNLGDSDNKWKDLYLSGNTIYLGSIKIKNLNNRGLILVDSDGKTLDLSIASGRASTLQVDSDMLVDGLTRLLGELSVKQNASFDSDVNVSGVVYAQSFKPPVGAAEMVFGDVVKFEGNVVFDSDVRMGQDLRIDSDVIIKGELYVGEPAQIHDTLYVKGKATFDSDVDVTGGLNVGRGAIFNDDVRFRDNALFDSDVIIQGNLIINGGTTTVNTENLTVKDGIITINSGQATPSRDGGVLFQRYDSDTVSPATPNSTMFWDESLKAFRWGYTGNNSHATQLTTNESFMFLSETGFVLFDSDNSARLTWSKTHSTLSILNKDGTPAFTFNADTGIMSGNGTIEGGSY